MTNPMRATIIPSDGFCSVDGVGFSGVDMTSVAADVHAVQWYATWGDVEIQDSVTGRVVRNEEIQSLDAFQPVLQSYWAIRNAVEAEQEEQAQEQTIIEV